VEFSFDTSVERIEVNGDQARGVTLAEGEHSPADVILANADLPYVYESLLPQDGMVKKLAKKQFSSSVISFFWGVDKPYASLGLHTLFLADDYKENFDCIIQDMSLPANPSLYVHAPARLDPAMAPQGQDTLTAIVPVGHISANGDQDWGEIRDQARQHVFRRLETLGIHDLEEHIKFEVNFNPLSWRKRYNLVHGSTHGLCHNPSQLAWFRPDNRHVHYHNLYFTGASTRPGTGMPTAMFSGRLSAQRIMDDMK
jgi:phytoene desaturase